MKKNICCVSGLLLSLLGCFLTIKTIFDVVKTLKLFSKHENFPSQYLDWFIFVFALIFGLLALVFVCVVCIIYLVKGSNLLNFTRLTYEEYKEAREKKKAEKQAKKKQKLEEQLKRLED